MAEVTRQEARERLGKDADFQTLLYTQDGVEKAKKLWKELAKARSDIRERKGSREPEDREIEWGWGNLEK